MRIVPRDYQIAADEALWQGLHANHNQNPLVVMATGLGKSLCMAMFAWRMLYNYPKVRILNVTHVKELIAGNYKAMKRLWPDAPAGVYSAGLNRKDTRTQITYCGIQSVAKRAASFGHVDFVLVDEAHRISPNTEASYGRFIQELRKVNPRLIVVGFTATGFRMTTGKLTDEGQLFDYEVFNLGEGDSFLWAIENGYLIKPVPVDPGRQLSEAGLHIRAGDFIDAEVSAAMRDEGLIEAAVDQMIKVAEEQGRRAWLTFNQSIDDAELTADIFRSKGYPVEAVHSKMDNRDDVLEKFKRGELRGVTNRDILTTGFDHPAIDMIGMLRMTRSPGLWVQMLGRGTRPVFAPGYDISTLDGRRAAILASHKQTCLVLDYVGNTMRLGPINYPKVRDKKKKGAGDAPVRCCPECAAYHHTSVRICDQCGYEFPPPSSHIQSLDTSDLVVKRGLDLNAVAKPPEYKMLTPHEIRLHHHKGKDGKPDTVKATYRCGMTSYNTWLCFDHPKGSFPQQKAQDWWRQHTKLHDGQAFVAGLRRPPDSVKEALEREAELGLPEKIKVRVDLKYPEIVDYDFRRNFNEEREPDPLAGLRKANAEADRHIENVLGSLTEDDIPF